MSRVGILHTKKDVQVWRHIPFIEGHYRLDYSFLDALFSLFFWHNETLNIWTHLLGFFLALAWMWYSLHSWLKDSESSDKLFFLLLMLSSQFQMVCSTFHHWFGCMNRTIYYLSARLDYSSIAILLPTGTSCAIHFILKCERNFMWFYSSLNILFGVGVMGFCWWPLFQTPAYQKFRAFLFSSLFLFVAFPWFHGSFLYNSLITSFPFFIQLLVVITMGIGVAVYLIRWPERTRPGSKIFSVKHNTKYYTHKHPSIS
jgi:predicted membrane channel-forming protein YqfA (hemolysin III family)